MKTLLALIAILSLAYGFDEQQKETTHQTFPAAARLEIDNISGFIHVTGYNGSEIQMAAEKTIDAESQDRLAAAQREVRLNITQSGDELRICVEGPFRDCANGGRDVHDHGHHGYWVDYDFELKVPSATILRLATVNHGGIRIESTSGDFNLSNVNGAIELAEVSGSGNAFTVNGKISASFARNPTAACSFKTVNGSIETAFRPNLSADVQVKTFNGGAYTDFDATALPRTAPVAEQRGGRFVYRSNRTSALRIGAGGPQFKFDTLNGSIRIIKRGQ